MSAAPPPLTIRALQATAVEVPMTYALGTSRQRVTAAPLLLLDLLTEEGVTGSAYLFCYLRGAAAAIATMVKEVDRAVKGDAVVPLDLWRKLATRFALIGVQGVVRMAMAGLDVAAWDTLAIAAGLPLVRLMGGEPKPVTAYNSCGLGLMDDPQGGGRRSGKAARRRLPCHQAAARLSDGAAGSRRARRRAQARR